MTSNDKYLAAEMELWGNTPTEAFAALFAEYQAVLAKAAAPVTIAADDFEHLALMGTSRDGRYCVGEGGAARVLDHAERLVRARPGRGLWSQTWQCVKDRQPPPHARYYVRRNGLIFTATPCYGMHRPWWVVRLMQDNWPNEADPEPMRDTDEWSPVEEPRT